MNRIEELFSNLHWMIHDLVDADQITNEDEIQLIKLKDSAFQEYKEFLEWKTAIEDACIVNWVPITNPKETIEKLIEWNVKMALDPAISKDASDLIERGRNEK